MDNLPGTFGIRRIHRLNNEDVMKISDVKEQKGAWMKTFQHGRRCRMYGERRN